MFDVESEIFSGGGIFDDVCESSEDSLTDSGGHCVGIENYEDELQRDGKFNF
jgi:hypothetical protein